MDSLKQSLSHLNLLLKISPRSVQLVLQRRARRARSTRMGGRRDPRLQEDVHPHPELHAGAPHGKIHPRRTEQVTSVLFKNISPYRLLIGPNSYKCSG